MNSNLKLLPAALTAALLALAGCGGGSDDTPPPTVEPETPTTPPPTALESAVDAADSAEAARVMAQTLHKGAVTASKAVSSKKVNGDSKLAYDNVLKILSARTLIEAEKVKAEAAVTTLKGLDATNARVAALLASAEADVATIQEILDGDEDTAGTLAYLADQVRGFSTDTNEELARSTADNVAARIMAALVDGTIGNAGTGTVGSAASEIKYVGSAGKTFSGIFGADSMEVAKLADLMVSGATTAFDPTILPTTAQGATDAKYKGIEGRIVCASATDCVYSAAGAITAGTLLFYPDDADAIYMPSGANYAPVTNAASYGYWLNTAGTAVHRQARTFTATWDTAGLKWDAATGDTETDATYTGKAGGYSELTTGSGATAKHESGEFVADVILEATFASAAANTTLSGSIENFAAKPGSPGTGHVNPQWTVDLAAKTNPTSFSAVTDVGTATRSGEENATDGDWTAMAYGSGGTAHPSGFVGAFKATFKDGSAAGVYQAD